MGAVLGLLTKMQRVFGGGRPRRHENAVSVGAGSDPPQTATKIQYETLLREELYHAFPSSSDPGGATDFDVLFIHGLQVGGWKDAWKDTWTSRAEGGVFWPSEWLGSNLPGARILVYSYNSSAIGSGQNLWSTAQRALQSVMDHQLGERPFFLVGHSLGGLLAKALVNHASHAGPNSGAREQFLFNLKGMVYYGVPHMGADLADLATMASRIARPSRFVQELRLFNDVLIELNAIFAGVQDAQPNIRAYAFAEGRKTPLAPGIQAWVVPRAVAVSGANLHESVEVGEADHFTICKPEAVNDLRYVRLRNFIQGNLGEQTRVMEFVT